jgi:hypoxanthine phosphoribosyltransferase
VTGEPNAGGAPAGRVGQVLISAEEITSRIGELAAQITEDYQGCQPLLVGVLKGAVMFMSDLARAIDLPVEIDFMAVSSYGESTKSSGVVRIVKDLETDIRDRHVLIVEDIVDSGLTLRYLHELLAARQPASLETCALLVKYGANTDARYVGFPIPPDFVIGYGLDLAELYRELPAIHVFEPDT